MKRDNRPERFTRRVIVAEDTEVEWFPDDVRHCAECRRAYFVAEGTGRLPVCCSPKCWLAHRNRLSREGSQRRRAA